MRTRASLLAASLLVAALSAGCTEEVTAVLGTDASFTLYGVLTPQADTQWVRVFPIAERLEPASRTSIDAVVRSTDLSDGVTRTWTDTTMVASDGMFGYFFFDPSRTAYGHTYRIEVERSDGARVVAEAAVPGPVELEHVDSGESSTVERILLRGTARHFINVSVTYDVKFGPVQEAESRFTARYDGAFEDHPHGSVLAINMAEAQQTMERLLRTLRLWSPAYGLVLHDMTVRLVVADPQWHAPDDAVTFDPLVLVQPGTLSNVKNGFGFVAAGYTLQTTWRPSDATLEAAGFNLIDD